MADSKTVQVRLSTKTVESLEALATRSRRTRSNVIKIIIESALRTEYLLKKS